MSATVVIAILIFVILALFAFRLWRTNSVERSIQSYKHRLGTIAEVVEQTTQARTTPTPTAVSNKIVNEASDDEIEDASFRPPRVGGELPPELGGRVYVSKEGRLVFGDSAMTPVVPPKPPIYEDVPHRRERTRRATHSRGVSDHRPLRTLLVGVATLIVIAGVAGGVYLSQHNKPPAVVTPTTVPAHQKGVSHKKTSVHKKASSTTGQLLSSNATTAVFREPSGTYSVTVYAQGVSWFGFERNDLANGPWLAMSTLGGVNPKSFTFSTKGSLAVVVGAPSQLTKVLVNNRPVDLPAQRGNSYVIEFQ